MGPDNEPGTLGDLGDVVVECLKTLDAVQKALQDGTKQRLELLVCHGAQRIYPTEDSNEQ